MAVAAWQGDVAFVRDGSIWLAGLDGTVVRVTHATDDASPAWSPDGSRVVFVRGTGAAAELYSVRVGGADLRRLTTDRLQQRDPRWSPTGDRIAYVQPRDTNGNGLADPSENEEIWLVRPDGSGAEKLVDGFDPAWAPDGGRLAFASNGLRRSDPPPGPANNAIRTVDLATRGVQDVLPLGGVPQRLEQGYGLPFRPNTSRVRAPSWAADGRRLAVSGDGHAGLALSIDERGGDPKIWVLNYEGGIGRVEYARRGSLLAIESRPATGYSRVVLVDTADGRRVEIGSERLDVSAEEPTFAPDGQRLAAVTHVGPVRAAGSRELLIFDSRGAATGLLAAGTISAPAWNPAR